MTPPTDKPENPWKKRRKGPQEFMPPSRALVATSLDGSKSTATWILLNNCGWQCASASRGLRWMMGSTDPIQARHLLNISVPEWHWIEPNTARVMAPSF